MAFSRVSWDFKGFLGRQREVWVFQSRFKTFQKGSEDFRVFQRNSGPIRSTLKAFHDDFIASKAFPGDQGLSKKLEPNSTPPPPSPFRNF